MLNDYAIVMDELVAAFSFSLKFQMNNLGLRALAKHFERGSAEGHERSDLSGWDCPSQPLEVDRLCHERSDLSGREAPSQPLEVDRSLPEWFTKCRLEAGIPAT